MEPLSSKSLKLVEVNMSSIFSKIIAGEIPCYKITEDEHHIAFLDVNPNSKGHTLCVPKKEVDKIFDLDAQAYTDLMMFSRTVALALRKVIPCKRIGVTVIGLEVPHTHVHLIPLNGMEDVIFGNKVALGGEEMSSLAEQISAAL
jgi:histidine triad (HIT) family protein